MKTGFLIGDIIMDVADYAKRYGVQALHPALYHMQDEGLLERCRRNGLAVHVWTVNEREYISKLGNAGIDAVITNFPDIAAEALQRTGSY